MIEKVVLIDFNILFLPEKHNYNFFLSISFTPNLTLIISELTPETSKKTPFKLVFMGHFHEGQ